MKRIEDYGVIMGIELNGSEDLAYQSLKEMYEVIYSLCETDKERIALLHTVWPLVAEEGQTPRNSVKAWVSQKDFTITVDEFDEIFSELREILEVQGPPWSVLAFDERGFGNWGYELDLDAIREDDLVYKCPKTYIDDSVLWEAVREGCEYIFYCSDHGNPNLIQITLDTRSIY